MDVLDALREAFVYCPESGKIFADGRTRVLGTFETPEAAHTAYVAAKRQLHEGCTL